MNRVEVISNKGKEFVYIDFSNIGVIEKEEITRVIEQAKNIIKTYPPASVMTIVNFINLRFSSQIIAELKEFTAHNKPYVKAGAVFGIQDAISKFVRVKKKQESGWVIIAKDKGKADVFYLIFVDILLRQEYSKRKAIFIYWKAGEDNGGRP